MGKLGPAGHRTGVGSSKVPWPEAGQGRLGLTAYMANCVNTFKLSESWL